MMAKLPSGDQQKQIERNCNKFLIIFLTHDVNRGKRRQRKTPNGNLLIVERQLINVQHASAKLPRHAPVRTSHHAIIHSNQQTVNQSSSQVVRQYAEPAPTLAVAVEMHFVAIILWNLKNIHNSFHANKSGMLRSNIMGYLLVLACVTAIHGHKYKHSLIHINVANIEMRDCDPHGSTLYASWVLCIISWYLSSKSPSRYLSFF